MKRKNDRAWLEASVMREKSWKIGKTMFTMKGPAEELAPVIPMIDAMVKAQKKVLGRAHR